MLQVFNVIWGLGLTVMSYNNATLIPRQHKNFGLTPHLVLLHTIFRFLSYSTICDLHSFPKYKEILSVHIQSIFQSYCKNS